MTHARVDLYGLTRDELRMHFIQWGLKPVHAARLWSYLYRDLASSFAAMPQLPEKLKLRLSAEARFDDLPVERVTDSSDGLTRKYLLQVGPEQFVETVRMHFTGRVTACLSSQVGCAMGCVFCATGQMGYTRHLTAGEIVAQAVYLSRALRAQIGDHPKKTSLKQISRGETSTADRDECHPIGDKSEVRLRNVVLMGMGEPLHNYEAVMKAVDILRDPNGLAIAAERITLSTVGVVPGIRRLAQEKRALHLAVSLHAATQAERAELVPVAKQWPLGELMAACRFYNEQTGRRIFYEWTLIQGKNDGADQARALGHLLRGLPAQVNLIPLNPIAGYSGTPGRNESARRFQKILADEFELPSTVRQRRGIDIAAGCGQLAGD